jgi:hypothetical protein
MTRREVSARPYPTKQQNVVEDKKTVSRVKGLEAKVGWCRLALSDPS